MENQWNQKVIENNGSFLQSLEWAKFQRSLGRSVWLWHDKTGLALVIRHNFPLGKGYLYCPRGPVSFLNDQIIEFLVKKSQEIGSKKNIIFLKIEPTHSFDFQRFGFRSSFRQIQPLKTLILDLDKDEDDLLKEMHSKTRYNIRLSQRKGVKIVQGNEYFEDFWRLLKKTAQRDKFRTHPYIYYKKILALTPQVSLKNFYKQAVFRLFAAQWKNKIVAANLYCFFGQRVTYLHGASDYQFRNLMAPHFLHWQVILKAKELGLKEYDFWGIDSEKWPGLTRFKKGFGGKEVVYPGSFDFVFSSFWYKIYQLTRRVLIH